MSKMECRYCMLKMTEEHDPRKLPCGHVFCLRCVKGDFSTSGQSGYQCLICRTDYGEIDFNSLPSAPTDASSVEKAYTLESKAAQMFCDRCKTSPAVKFCADCGEKSCFKHSEFHDGYYEDLHDTIDIMKYAANPNLYNKTIRCEHHTKENITMACKHCYQYNCVQCTEKPTVCTGAEEHAYLQLASIESEIKLNIGKQRSLSQDKLVKLEKVEKDAQRKLDSLTQECKDLRTKLETKSTEQIKLIQDQTNELKEEIDKYETDATKSILEAITKFTSAKEEIESACANSTKFIRDSHVSILIKRRHEELSRITTAAGTYASPVTWRKKSLKTGKKRKLEVEFTDWYTERSSYMQWDNGLQWDDEIVPGLGGLGTPRRKGLY